MPYSRKKFCLTAESILDEGRVLYRIQALVDIAAHGVSKGDLGGFVERENNLSHAGGCWVGRNARVMDDAKVSDNAIAFGNAHLSGKAKLRGNAGACGNARLSGEVELTGSAQACGNAVLTGNVILAGLIIVSQRTHLEGGFKIEGEGDLTSLFNASAKEETPPTLSENAPETKINRPARSTAVAVAFN